MVRNVVRPTAAATHAAHISTNDHENRRNTFGWLCWLCWFCWLCWLVCWSAVTSSAVVTNQGRSKASSTMVATKAVKAGTTMLAKLLRLMQVFIMCFRVDHTGCGSDVVDSSVWDWVDSSAYDFIDWSARLCLPGVLVSGLLGLLCLLGLLGLLGLLC